MEEKLEKIDSEIELELDEKMEVEKISLDELFEKYNGGKLDNTFEWDEPVDKEIW